MIAQIISIIVGVYLGIGALFALHAIVVNWLTGWPPEFTAYEKRVLIAAMWLGWPLIFISPGDAWTTSR